MGRISNDFFNDNESCNKNIESKLNFYIDNYGELMRVFYLIDAQMKHVQKEKEDAHNGLIEIRKEEKKLRIMAARGEEIDVIQIQNIEARKKQYKKVIRNSHINIITNNGEPLETDHYTNFIINNIKYFRLIAQYDMKVRTPIATGVKKIISVVIWPINRILLKTIALSDDDETKRFLEKVWCLCQDLPENFEHHIKKEF